MIPQNTVSYLMATAALLDIKSHPNRQQCNLWTVTMCLCENNRIESWQIQMGENETLHILKTKSNFTLLLFIPFLGIGEWYFKCVQFILKFNQLFI